jgi:hypothetical protein
MHVSAMLMRSTAGILPLFSLYDIIPVEKTKGRMHL